MKYILKDLLDIPKLQAILDALNEIHSMPSAIIDTEGNILTATAWQDICTKFHRVNPETEKRCRESDSYIVRELDKNPPHVIYRCPFGLVDTATPIIVESHHLGNVFTGQLFTEPPDEERFIRQAREHGFDEKKYLEALRKVPMISEEHLLKNLKFLNRFTEMLASQGLIYKRQLEMEAMLRKSEEKYRELFDSSTDAVFILDLAGNFIDVNKTAYTRLGYTKEEMMSLHISRLDPPEFGCKIPERLAQISKFGQAVFESAHIRKDGAVMPVEVNSRLLDYEGKKVYFSVIRDITERKRTAEEKEKLQAQLQQAQKMESVGHLAGGIAHDFNNILSAIVGYAHIMLMKMNGNDPLRTHLEHIIVSSEKAANLTKSLLAFSRKQAIQMNNTDINDIVNGMTGILDRIIGEDIYLRVHMASHELIVRADRNQIEQVLMNLATNARDAMPDGGIFEVTTEEIVIDEKYTQMYQAGKTGKYAVISVTDTGIGMDERTKENIFDPFFTTKEVGKGTGLGLAMIYGTIKQHNGFINVYSEPGKGTTFRIYLPSAEPGSTVTEKKVEDSIPAGTETVLLVEDDEAVRSATKALLQEFGYSVIEAIDGKQAVTLFRENRDIIQLVITDIIMPGQSGKELYNELLRITPGIKIIFVSGYPTDILAQKGIIDSDVNFILKPVTPKMLLNKVRKVLDE